MNIFISGSISIKKLPKIAVQKIDSIISKDYHILLGDAKGVDLCVQKYLHECNYSNVDIYCAGTVVRNNIGNWNIYAVPENGEKGRMLYTLKDKEMSKNADYGMMIWDGKSEGTLNNISMMNSMNKKFFVILEGAIVDQEHLGAMISMNSRVNHHEAVQTAFFEIE